MKASEPRKLHNPKCVVWISLYAVLLASCTPRQDARIKAVGDQEAAQKDQSMEEITSLAEAQKNPNLSRQERNQNRVKAFLSFSNFVKGAFKLITNKSDNSGASDVARAFRYTESGNWWAKRVLQHPIGKELLENHFGMNVKDGFLQPIQLDPARLIKLPENTLGHQYAQFMKKHGFSPDFYEVEKSPPDDHVGYLLIRVAQMHDMWHIVTGFGPEFNGEQALQAFGLAQNYSPASIVFMAGDLVLSAFANNPKELCVKMAHMALGFKMGKRADLLVAQKWENLLEKDLGEVRKMLRVTPVSALNFDPENSGECD